jgi:endonuclease-3
MKQKVTIYQLYDIFEEAIKPFPLSFAEYVHETYKSPFFTLLSILLSARTKDSLTITKMPRLWEAGKTPADFVKIDQTKLEALLKPIGFYPTKAKHIKSLSALLLEKYNGEVPNTMDELLTLPGVGRKTANLTLSVVFDVAAICVDTHVHRIMNHLGYVTTSSPEETEMALRVKLPKDLWQRTNRILVLVGQHLSNHIQMKDPNNILNQYELTE